MIRAAGTVLAAALLAAGCAEPAQNNPNRSEGLTSSEGPRSAAPDGSKVSPRPVQIGFDGPRFDACAGYGEVKPLNPAGDNYLAVRAAPSINADEIDRLTSGTGLSMCQQVGDWIGVVYAPDQEEPVQCGTSSPVSSKREYEGPCKSGWVNENYITLVAG